MKITLLTVGSHGDVRPYVALGKGLLEAGFEVCIGTHAEFDPFVRAHGLDFHAVKGNPREVLESPQGQEFMASGSNLLKFVRNFRLVAQDAMREGFDDCLAAAQGADALIVPFFVAAVGYQIARKLNQKTIVGYLQPMTPTGAFPVMTLPNLFLGGLFNRASHHVGRLVFWQAFRDIVDDWSRESLDLGPLPPWGPLGAMERRSLVLHGYSRHLVPKPGDWPSWHHVTGFWLLPEGEDYVPSPELAAFLEAGPPPVYAGFGSMPDPDAASSGAKLIQALQTAGQRGVMMRGWGGIQAHDLPEGMHLIEHIPHDWLFPQCRAVIHHCGAGTTASALQAGVPQIGVPFFADQGFWAQRIFGMGAGPRPIPRPQLSVPKLNEALAALKQPRYAERAQRLSERMRQEGGVNEAVRLIRKHLKA